MPSRPKRTTGPSLIWKTHSSNWVHFWLISFVSKRYFPLKKHFINTNSTTILLVYTARPSVLGVKFQPKKICFFFWGGGVQISVMLSDGLVGNLTSSVKPPKGTMDIFFFGSYMSGWNGWSGYKEPLPGSKANLIYARKAIAFKIFKCADAHLDAFCAWFVVSSAIASKTFSPNLHMWSVLSLEGRYVDWFGYVWVLDGTCIYQNFQSFWGPTRFPSASSCLCTFYGLENLEYIQEMLGFW